MMPQAATSGPARPTSPSGSSPASRAGDMNGLPLAASRLLRLLEEGLDLLMHICRHCPRCPPRRRKVFRDPHLREVEVHLPMQRPIDFRPPPGLAELELPV